MGDREVLVDSRVDVIQVRAAPLPRLRGTADLSGVTVCICPSHIRHDQEMANPRSPHRDSMDNFFLRSVRSDEVRLLTEINDDACLAYREYGLTFDIGEDHPFVLAEAARWNASAMAGRASFACAPDPVGFVALGFLDGKPYLEQVSVRRAWARRGIGTALVVYAQRWSLPHGELWLTTYDGVPFNRNFYEGLGFEVAAAGPELSATLDKERAALPAPERRISMRYRMAST